jgi:putative ABC transport system ATP-binding protein
MGEQTIVAVDHINLEVEAGEYIAFMGPSGAGKSTLLYLLGGLDRPSQGKICVAGKEITKLSERELARYRNQNVAFIFQDFNLQDHLNVLENIVLPLKFREVAKREREKIAMSLIERLGLSQRLRHKPSELSGGERQRVAVARALCGSPQLLLADEPTGNLDSKTGAEIVSLLSDLNKNGITILVVTHNHSVAQTAQKIYTIQDGKIVHCQLLSAASGGKA